MSLGEIGIALGSGAVGAGVMKLLDTLLANGLARKAKKQDTHIASITKIEDDLRQLEKRVDVIEPFCERSENSDQIILKTLNVLLTHAITGNATGEMRKVQIELVNSIVDNK